MTIADMLDDLAQTTAMTITGGGIIIIFIITSRTAITITKTDGIKITTTIIITAATVTIDDVAFTESCCPRARCS